MGTPTAAPTPPIPAEPPPVRSTPPAAGYAKAARDPAVLMIGLGACVLLVALWWLLVTPRGPETLGADSARIAALEQRLTALDSAAAETARELRQLARPNEQLAGLATAQAAAARDLATTREAAAAAAAAAERRLAALEARPTFDPQGPAFASPLAALNARMEELGQRLRAAEAEQARSLQDGLRQQEERRTAGQQAAEQRLAAIDAGVTQRVQGAIGSATTAAAAATEERLRGLEGSVGARLGTLESGLGQRLATAEAGFGQRLGALESGLTGRLTALEQAQARMAALEGRTARLTAIDGLLGSLTAGQPLGTALARIDNPPAALARYRDVAPPTEAGLRLSFEQAAAAGRAASDAGARPAGGERSGVVDSALARLGGLVTVRRGDQVVWGDAAEAEIERARRALEAGDLPGALGYLDKLPPAAKQAMQGWIAEAQALLAARAALRQLAAG